MLKNYLTVLFLIIPLLCLSQKYDAEILNFNTTVDYNGRNIKETYEYEIQINNGGGTKYAEIEIFYQLKNAPKNLQADIYDVFGNKIRSLKKKEIVTKTPWSGSEFHTDHRTLNFTLIHNRFPYIIKYSYSININNYISLAYWSPIIDPKIKTQKSKLILQVPIHTPLNIYKQQIDSANVKTIEDNDIYTWELKNYTSPQNEPFSPHINKINPMVEVMPERFFYGVQGEVKSWKDFGNWKYELIKGLDVLTPEESKKVHKITDSIPDVTDKIKTLYHYMQDNTRYILISLKQGGLIPYPASYVCTNRFGDCKALSNYMKALLKEIDVESYYTTIYSGLKPNPVNSEFPSHQSNHIILCVPLQQDTIWLECTDKTSPFNYLSSYTQNRLALTIDKNQSKLVKTPKHNLCDATQSYTTHVIIQDGKGVTFTSKAKIKGNEFDNFKSFDTQLSDKNKEQYIDHIGLMSKADIIEFNINRPHRDSTWLELLLKGTVQSLSENLGSKILLKPFKTIKSPFEAPEKRKNDLFIYYPINKCDTIIYEFPKKINDVKGLSQTNINSRFGSYKRIYTIDNNKLIITRIFQVKQARYPLKDYAEFYEFYKKSAQLDNQKMIINLIEVSR